MGSIIMMFENDGPHPRGFSVAFMINRHHRIFYEVGFIDY